MHTPDPIRVVRIALRVSLAAAFLSAVADRLGWWEPFGQGSWGSMGSFADYTHQLVPFAFGRLLTVIVWAATVTEATLGALLLTGWRPKLVGAANHPGESVRRVMTTHPTSKNAGLTAGERTVRGAGHVFGSAFGAA